MYLKISVNYTASKASNQKKQNGPSNQLIIATKGQTPRFKPKSPAIFLGIKRYQRTTIIEVTTHQRSSSIRVLWAPTIDDGCRFGHHF
jgi:hypothetical protein